MKQLIKIIVIPCVLGFGVMATACPSFKFECKNKSGQLVNTIANPSYSHILWPQCVLSTSKHPITAKGLFKQCGADTDKIIGFRGANWVWFGKVQGLPKGWASVEPKTWTK